jgi:outer membrane immunogenic protein
MKKLMVAGVLVGALGGVASAAELPVKAPYQPPPPVWSWTGFYIGANGGYGVANDDVTQTIFVTPPAGPLTFFSPFQNSLAPKGGFGGGQIGFNWQTGAVVWGVEGDYQGASQTSTTVCGGFCVGATIPGVVTTIAANSVYQKVKSFATVRGRVGYANNGALIYVTGGGAWIGIDETDTFGIAVTPGGPFFAQGASFSNTKSGFSVGAGIEMRLWLSNWTAKIEYLHLDVSGTTNTFALSPTVFGVAAPLTTTSGRIRDDIFRVGVNYKFGWGGYGVGYGG